MRKQGNIRTLIVNRLQSRADAGDRPAFEREIRRFQTELQDAAASCGVKIEGSRLFGQEKALWKLLLAPMPHLREAAEAIVELVPEDFKWWARYIETKLVSPTPMQMLFLNHARPLRLESAQPTQGRRWWPGLKGLFGWTANRHPPRQTNLTKPARGHVGEGPRQSGQGDGRRPRACRRRRGHHRRP
jgi:hypothetical protein